MNSGRNAGKMLPQEVFRVADEVNHLDSEQAKAFEQAFREWKGAAKRADSVRARERMWFIFLLLRHTGARLGEVLDLDESADFDFERGMVRLGKEGKQREVPVPEELQHDIQALLDSPMGYSLRGSLFHVDPGYFRRICYARGKECGLPKRLAGPKVLRNTRAVELLRSGVPITVVKEILGQSSLNLTAGYQQFSADEATTIVRMAHDAMRKQTSARNSFVGTVIHVVHDAVMAEVTLETRTGIRVSAVITTDSLKSLRFEEGSPVIATIKAPLVNVVPFDATPTPGGPCNAKNRLHAKVLRVVESPVLAEVVGKVSDGTEVCALVSTHTVRNLDLKVGDEMEFRFKSLSVVLNSVQV